MHAMCTVTHGIHQMEIIKFVPDFDVNRSQNWEIKQKLPQLQPVGEQNRFPTMLLN